MLDVYAVLGGPGELSLAFRVIDEARKTSGRGAALIVDRVFEGFARRYNGVDDVIALDIPSDTGSRSVLLKKLSAKIAEGGAHFHAPSTSQLVDLTLGRGLAVSDTEADGIAQNKLGEIADARFALAIAEAGGLERTEHLSEIAWAVQRRGLPLVVASMGAVAQSPFWRSMQGVDSRVLAQMARRCALAITASTSCAYFVSTYAPVTCIYLMPGGDPTHFWHAGVTAEASSLTDATTRLPLAVLLRALGEEMRDRVCPDCGKSSGGLAITRNARWVACNACPAIYPTPIAA